ncbi:alpha/beta fold hydrolase [Kocuria sp. M1R5S2]|uniref:alpha/beta fold hydrolase n=1 Tax=Kocuria rhizosphaerae TaxID=3376285 RepID=UPI003788231F
MARTRPSTTERHAGPGAALRHLTPVPLPGVDPAWSRTLAVPSTAGVEPVRGRPRRWHLLDNLASLEAAGLTPRGTVLAVHGNPTWSYLWRSVLAAGLDPDNPWRVVAVDQLDMGFSERTGLFRRLDDRVTDLGDLTAELGLDTSTGPVVTLAHDWGGLISAGWALEHLGVHRGTVMTNTAVHHDGGERIPAALSLALAPAAHGLLTDRTTAFLDAALALADPAPPPEVRAAYRAPYTTRARREAIRHFVADIPAPPEHPSHERYEQIAAGVAGLEVPALLLWGTGDPVFQERYLQDLVRRMPHADVHRFEGARHLLPEARDVAGPVMAWLADQFGPGPTRRELHLRRRATARGAHVPFTAQLADRRADTDPAVVDMAPSPGDPQAGARVPPVRASLNWAELAERVDRLAAGLTGAGVRRGDRVNLMVPPGSDLTALLYACLRIGAVVVVADSGLGPRGLTRALRGAGPAWLVGVRKALVAARALGWPGTRIAVERLDPVTRRALGVAHDVPGLLGAAPRPDLPGPDPDADAVVLFTSGSTGPAKGVVYTHRQLAAMRDAVREACGLSPGTALVAGFAPFALLGPALGATSVTPDMDVTAPKTLTARALADAAAAIRATALFLSPAAIANVIDTQDDLDAGQRRALGLVETVLSAGAPLPERLLERFQELVPAASVHTPYGMTEGLPLTDVTLEEIRRARRDSANAPEGTAGGVCVGTAVHGAELGVTALRPDGTPGDEITTEPGVTGEIVARAPHLKDRYDRLWYTEHLSTQLPGWHRTGDVGHVDAAGRLWVEGRLAHVVLAAEGVLTPVSAEHAAQTVAGVGRAAVVGVGPAGAQVAVAVVETVPAAPAPGLADPLLSGAVRDAVREATGTDLAAVLVLPEHPTDVRHNSKIDRALLAGWADSALAGGRISNP